MTLMEEYDHRRERAAQDAENSARLAQSYCVFKSIGVGTTQYEERVPFGLTFIEKPVVSYACYTDVDELETDDDVDAILPNCTGYVTRWDQDERDFYVGCWVAARVHFDLAEYTGNDSPQGVIEVEHHFTFAGVGMKDIPPDQSDAVE